NVKITGFKLRDGALVPCIAGMDQAAAEVVSRTISFASDLYPSLLSKEFQQALARPTRTVKAGVALIDFVRGHQKFSKFAEVRELSQELPISLQSCQETQDPQAPSVYCEYRLRVLGCTALARIDQTDFVPQRSRIVIDHKNS